MWYLWLQILFLLALAALCGAGLAYWWLKGRYEDVTETYSEMMINKGGSPDLITRPDLDARFADLSAKIDRIEATDLTPLHSQITSLADGLPSNEVELSPILSEIHAIGGDLRSSENSMQSLDERLAAIEASLHQANAGQDRLDELNKNLIRGFAEEYEHSGASGPRTDAQPCRGTETANCADIRARFKNRLSDPQDKQYGRHLCGASEERYCAPGAELHRIEGIHLAPASAGFADAQCEDAISG